MGGEEVGTEIHLEYSGVWQELVALQRLKQWDHMSGRKLVYTVRPWRQRDWEK